MGSPFSSGTKDVAGEQSVRAGFFMEGGGPPRLARERLLSMQVDRDEAPSGWHVGSAGGRNLACVRRLEPDGGARETDVGLCRKMNSDDPGSRRVSMIHAPMPRGALAIIFPAHVVPESTAPATDAGFTWSVAVSCRSIPT